MAYVRFGWTPADYVIDAAGTPQPGATGTAWTAPTGGTQVTDLRLGDGTTASTTVVATARGDVRFFAQDTNSTLWLDFGGGARYAVSRLDTAVRTTTVEAALAGKQATIPKYATQAAALAGLAAGEFADGDLIIVLG